MRNIKKISIKNCPYYIFNDMINIKNFDPNLLSTGKISLKNIYAVIYNTNYITILTMKILIVKILSVLFLIM